VWRTERAAQTSCVQEKGLEDEPMLHTVLPYATAPVADKYRQPAWRSQLATRWLQATDQESNSATLLATSRTGHADMYRIGARRLGFLLQRTESKRGKDVRGVAVAAH
jgi:hypothetical protein